MKLRALRQSTLRGKRAFFTLPRVVPHAGLMRRAAAAIVNHDTVTQAAQAASAVPVPPVDAGLTAHIATALDAAQHVAHQV